MSFLDFFRKNKQKTNTIASLHTSTSSDDSKDIKSENNVEHIDDNERKIAREKNNFYKAVFLDRYSTGVHIMSDTEYPRYFYYDFGIKSPSSFHKKLIREGYYSPSEISDILESMRISDLKIVLKNLNTTTTGKKSELINRILNSTSSELYRKNLFVDVCRPAGHLRGFAGCIHEQHRLLSAAFQLYLLWSGHSGDCAGGGAGIPPAQHERGFGPGPVLPLRGGERPCVQLLPVAV